MCAALDTLDDERAPAYLDATLCALSRALREELLRKMKVSAHQFESKFFREYGDIQREVGKAEGRAEVEAKGVIAVLETRFQSLTPGDQESKYGKSWGSPWAAS